jgi:deoxyribonuclease V
MFAAVDAHYPAGGGAYAALVVAADPAFRTLTDERVAHVAEVPEYRPGEFYLRELPALRAVLAGAGPFRVLVVDGYVDLDPAGRPGLGAHVAAALGGTVIGVAKTRFRAATHAAEVRRGSAVRPLYVTARGMPVAEAGRLVERMAGPHRIPEALRRVDALARAAETTG